MALYWAYCRLGEAGFVSETSRKPALLSGIVNRDKAGDYG